MATSPSPPGDHSFRISLNRETISIVARTRTREIHRSQAYATGQAV
jgi:hypothetical protein